MTLKQLFTIPEPFTPSDLTLWQDEYISSLLLQAHLNPHHDNASRQHEFIEHSSQWILSKVKHKHSLLDLGCGPGLYTSIFAKEISDVTGIDFSSRSIDYAKNNDSKSNYILGNYLNLDLSKTFDVITMIHCEYGSLSPSDRKNLLQKIKNHLKTDGTFFFDVFTPSEMDDFEQAQRWALHKHGFYSNQPYTEVILNKIYPNAITLRQSTIIQDDSVRIFRQWYQYFTLDKIRDELNDAGLKILEVYNDLKGTPYQGNGNTLALEVGHL